MITKEYCQKRKITILSIHGKGRIMVDYSKFKVYQFERNTPRPKPTKEQIRRIERYCGIELPDSYLEFLAHHNGGSPELSVFDCYGEKRDIDRLYPLTSDYDDPKKTLSVETILKTGSWPGNDRKYIPIGHDPSGNMVCLDLSPKTKGQVILWDHDTPGEEIRKVADSFEEFISSLKLRSPDDF